MRLADAGGDRLASLSTEAGRDVQVAGRIGEFGQPVIQRKADQLMSQFAECLARTLA